MLYIDFQFNGLSPGEKAIANRGNQVYETSPSSSPATDPMSRWSELPQGLLVGIACSLEITDRAAVAVVCSSWRTISLAAVPYAFPRQTPWLFICPYICSLDDDNVEHAADSVVTICPVIDPHIHRITIPSPCVGRWLFVGSSNGCLIAADGRSNLHLVSPFTRARRPLPPVAAFDFVERDVLTLAGCMELPRYAFSEPDDGYAERVTLQCTLSKMHFKFYHKAVLSSDLPEHDCVVAVIYGPWCTLATARVADGAAGIWRNPPGAVTSSNGINYRDCIFIGKKIYAVAITGIVESWDLDGADVVRPHGMIAVDGPCSRVFRSWMYIVEAPSGGYSMRVYLPRGAAEIVALVVDTYEGVVVDNAGVGDHALFLGFNSSVWISTSEFPTLRRNCIYFSSYNKDEDERVYSLRDGTTESFLYPDAMPVSVGNIMRRFWVTPVIFSCT